MTYILGYPIMVHTLFAIVNYINQFKMSINFLFQISAKEDLTSGFEKGCPTVRIGHKR